jgi:hypothetical protein
MADNSDELKKHLQTISKLKERIEYLESQLELPLLQGKDEILEYCKMSEYIAKKWIKNGLPVLIVDGTWYAHRDNIKEYFKARTRVDSSKNPEISG